MANNKQPGQPGQPGQPDGMNYVPTEIRNLMTNYQNDPNSLSTRQAVFSKLYNNGGDQQKLALALSNSDSAEGYDGLRNQLITAYAPQGYENYTSREAALHNLQQHIQQRKGGNSNSVPNLSAVQQGQTAQAAAPAQQEGTGGIYQNLPQNSALLFLRDRNNQ